RIFPPIEKSSRREKKSAGRSQPPHPVSTARAGPLHPLHGRPPGPPPPPPPPIAAAMRSSERTEVVGTAGPARAAAVREHEVLLTTIARRLCANQADAADLVQDTYERALRGWDHYADRGTLRSWLVTILNNLFIDRCRKERRGPRRESI